MKIFPDFQFKSKIDEKENKNNLVKMKVAPNWQWDNSKAKLTKKRIRNTSIAHCHLILKDLNLRLRKSSLSKQQFTICYLEIKSRTDKKENGINKPDNDLMLRDLNPKL